MKKIITTLLLLFSGIAAYAQLPEDALPYKNGEKLKMVVSYKAKMWPNTDMADLTFSVSEDELFYTPAFKITANASVKSVYGWFYKLNDTYSAWINRYTLLPMRASAELIEGDYRFSSVFSYDWEDMTVFNRTRNHKRAAGESRTMHITEGSMDGLSLFYSLRKEDIQSFEEGESRDLKLVLDDTVRTIRLIYYGRELKHVSGLGEVKTLKFSCQLATSTGESFEDGSEFYIWISDDPNKVPVYLESPIKVGSVRARLVYYENLKYPESSVLP